MEKTPLVLKIALVIQSERMQNVLQVCFRHVCGHIWMLITKKLLKVAVYPYPIYSLVLKTENVV